MAERVYVKYRDHVLYHRGEPAVMKPQIREAIGWLLYENQDYITICWDRDAEPPTLKGGDPKASGLVLLRSDIMELKKIC
jgi:signal peptidase I